MSTPYELLSPEAREKLEAWAANQRQLLAELLEDAGSDLQREFIDRAIVAGHTPAEVHAFADELRSMEDDEAFTACTLDADAPEGYTVNQLLRAESDPLYAFELKGGSLSPADDGADAPVTTELSVDTSETGEPEATPPRPPPVTVPPAPVPAPVSPLVSGRPPVSSKVAPAAAPPVLSVKDLAPPGTMSPTGTLRPRDLAPAGTMSPGGTLRPKDLAPAGALTPGGSKRPAPADTQPHAAFRPPAPGVVTPGASDTRPQPAFRPSGGSDLQPGFKPPLPGTSGPAPADTQPHPAFKPPLPGTSSTSSSGVKPAVASLSPGGQVPFRPPPPGVAMPGTGVAPAFKPDPSRELGGAAAAPSGTHRSGGGLPMSPRDSGAPPVPARMLARELGASAESARGRAGGSSPALGQAPVANKLCEDVLTDACRPFGLSFREYDVDLEGSTTLEQALEQAAIALQRGVMVPVCLGPLPGQHRRFAVLMQLSVVGANRAWQLYEMTTQELMWMNEGDLLARKELPFANKANRRITRLALPNIKASDF